MKRLVVPAALTIAGMMMLATPLTSASASAATESSRPVIVSVVATPKTLPAAGGTVRLVIRDKFATTCTISVVPKIAHFPKSFRCSSGHLTTAVSIAKNTDTEGQTIRFRVSAKGPGGSTPVRAAVVSQATDIGPIGATLNVHDSSGDTLAVALTQIVDPATGADQYTTPNPGDRFVAVEMTLSNQSSATISGDANSDTTVIGTDSQAYTADFDSVAQCTNFSYGEFTILQGSPSESGCVVFQLPNGVNVKAVQFSFDSAYLDTAQWNA